MFCVRIKRIALPFLIVMPGVPLVRRTLINRRQYSHSYYSEFDSYVRSSYASHSVYDCSFDSVYHSY